MFHPEDILYEDNHLLAVNKRAGDLVQPDPDGSTALETEIRAFLKHRGGKPGEAFLGVVHRIDRPVSGVVLFAKTGKALARLNAMLREGRIDKTYWAITERAPAETQGRLRHYIARDGRANISRAHEKPTPGSREALLDYRLLCSGERCHLLEIRLLTGRHHQIRAQLSAVGCPIRGDLKYGAARSNRGGGISLHSRATEFVHPVRNELLRIVAPPPGDNLWAFFEKQTG
ncbi:MAG: RluA family pseudouridine synthase [Rikenellaceae bacterium]|jgi:23S rRNA pseudouridine1911/1915/1917 synthase|nr:RluA family pseudouridine synthase [Rikenellaceae bacterium]